MGSGSDSSGFGLWVWVVGAGCDSHGLAADAAEDEEGDDDDSASHDVRQRGALQHRHLRAGLGLLQGQRYKVKHCKVKHHMQGQTRNTARSNTSTKLNSGHTAANMTRGVSPSPEMAPQSHLWFRVLYILRAMP